MTSQEFKIKVDTIAKEHGWVYDGTQYTKNTMFGVLSLKASSVPKIGLYTVYMKFQPMFDYRNFNEVYGLEGSNRLWSRKWNIHNSDYDFVLTELNERLDNINYLTKNN